MKKSYHDTNIASNWCNIHAEYDNSYENQNSNLRSKNDKHIRILYSWCGTSLRLKFIGSPKLEELGYFQMCPLFPVGLQYNVLAYGSVVFAYCLDQ